MTSLPNHGENLSLPCYCLCPHRMNNHRIRGFATLHNAGLLLSTFVWFWMIHYFWEASGRELINLPWNYALVAAVGLFLASFGTFKEYGSFLLKRGWSRLVSSVMKANFQVALIAFFVFAAYFATKDKSTSRLFLGSFIGSCWPVLVLVNYYLPILFLRAIHSPSEFCTCINDSIPSVRDSSRSSLPQE